ncbi:MAG: Abi family protein [Gammaproteobacteria bacterium]|nr:Abi family protein [Gammaproteobacteria bacterium]
MTRRFRKPPLSYRQQLELLIERGLIVDDPAEAQFYLQHLNYYRLGAYWLPFEADHGTHQFRPGTRFSEILNLYVFDRELRLLVMDAIERVEVSIRSHWAYQLARLHNPHAHLDPALARRRDRWQQNLASLTDEVNRSDEVFIEHFRTTYQEALPPVWAVCEVMSLGQLSRWYANLRPKATRRAIADVYHTDEGLLQSWLHHLSHVRNVCAHHSRLWNREFTITPKPPRTKPSGLDTQWAHGSRKLYNSLVVLLHCMDIVSPGHHWCTRLRELVAHHGIDTAAMDFPSDWQAWSIWRTISKQPTGNGGGDS